MGKLALGSEFIDKYFELLKNIDTESKKRLIVKLTESIESGRSSKIDLETLFGAWIDERDAEEIIKENRESRVNIKYAAKLVKVKSIHKIAQ